MLRERLYFEVEGAKKKEILEALKNEQRYNKKIPIFNPSEEEIAKVVKWDDYFSYIDLWLDDVIDESLTQNIGRIASIETYLYEKKEGVQLPRIKKIIA